MPLKASKENGCYILDVHCEELTHNVLCAIKDIVEKHKKSHGRRKFALNLEKTQGINDDFLGLLRAEKLSVFGANSEVLGYMSLTNTINLIPVYHSKSDFMNDKRKFIKRNFRVVKQLCQPLLAFAPFLSSFLTFY